MHLSRMRQSSDVIVARSVEEVLAKADPISNSFSSVKHRYDIAMMTPKNMLRRRRVHIISAVSG